MKMLSDVTRPDVDPELERQIANAADDELVEVVLLMREPSRTTRPPEATDKLLKRMCGNEPPGTVESTYLPRIGALIVRAPASVIRRLIAQPEVEIACANRGTGAADGAA
jgi:hypothetical protein